MKKIAFFLDTANGLGGAGNLLLKQAVLMSEEYCVIVVIPTDADGNPNAEYAKRCDKQGIKYRGIRYNISINFSDIDITRAMENVSAIEKFAREESIDFFHSVQLNLAVEYVSRKMQIPHLMNIYQIEEQELDICRQNIFPAYHLCDSNLYANIWSSKLGIESRCIRPVAELKNIKKKEVYRKKELNVLMLGTVCSRKNQLIAIQALEPLLREGKLRLEIAGHATSQYAIKCKEYVMEHGLSHKVKFYDFVSDVSELLENADCLLCASTFESFPSSIVEAVTYDLTIISTPVAGVPEVFQNKKNSFISENFSKEAIAESVKECLRYHKNGEIKKIHINAACTWAECFARDRVKEQINLYYKYILEVNERRETEIYWSIAKQAQEIEQLLDCSKHGIPRHGFYYCFLKEKLKEGCIYIWGAGKRGKIAYRLLKIMCPMLQIKAFIDEEKSGYLEEIPIIKLPEVPFVNSFFYGISFLDGKEEAIHMLEEKGLMLNQQILLIP